MKTNMNFLPIGLCKKLQGIMNLKSHFVYNKEQIINPEIVKKHGNLTDDGYYELTKDCGGPYNFNEVYIYDYKLMLRRDVWVEKEMVYAYTIEQVFTWLREEKDIHIITVPEKIYDYTCYGLQIIQFNSPKHNFDNFRMNSSYDNIDYCDVCIIGIEYVINNLI